MYENVLLYCESDDISGLSNNTQEKNYIQFIKENGIELEYNAKTKKARKAKSYNLLNTYLAPSVTSKDIQDKIIFTATQNKVFKSLFFHIRNAFAHNQIKIDGDYVLMYDKLPPSKNKTTDKMTMIGHIKKETLRNLIIRLKSI